MRYLKPSDWMGSLRQRLQVQKFVYRGLRHSNINRLVEGENPFREMEISGQ